MENVLIFQLQLLIVKSVHKDGARNTVSPPSLPLLNRIFCFRHSLPSKILPLYADVSYRKEDIPQNTFECDREIVWFIADWSCCVIVFVSFFLLNKQTQILDEFVKHFVRYLVFWPATKRFLSKCRKSFDFHRLDLNQKDCFCRSSFCSTLINHVRKIVLKKVKFKYCLSLSISYHNRIYSYIRIIKNFVIFFSRNYT